MNVVSIDRLTPKGGLVGGPFGSSLVNADYVSEGIPVIRGLNLNFGKYVGGNHVFVSREKFDRDLRRNSAVSGDLIFTQRGTIGQVAIINDSLDRTFVVSQSQMRLRVDQSIADPQYVYYICSSASFVRQVMDHAIATGVPHINLGILAKLTVSLPGLNTQKAIAAVLGALDDKIAANIKLLGRFDEAATLHFASANAAAEHREHLASLVSTQYGLTTSTTSDPGPKLARVTDINKKAWIDWDSAPSCVATAGELRKYGTHPGDILVARMADPGKAGYVDEGAPEAVFASYLVRLAPVDPQLSLYLYYFLRSPNYQRYAESAMQGSVQMNMNAKVIVATDIDLPSPDTIVRFISAVAPLRSAMAATLAENATLANIRDTLLPQLMSGKLRVRDAERTVSEVL